MTQSDIINNNFNKVLKCIKSSNAYLTGEILNEEKCYTQIYNLKHGSTVTSIDIIKDNNYTVIGSPTITDDGVVSNYSKNNAIKANISATPTTSIKIKSSYTWNTDESATLDNICVPYVLGTKRWRLDFRIANNTLSVYCTNDLDASANTKFNIPITDLPANNAKIKVEETITKINRTVNVTINGTVYTGTTTFANEQTFEQIQLTLGNASLTGNSDYLWCGTQDLNEFLVYVDGNLVYQPCLKIPYTNTKAGIKISNSIYRDRINIVYEQYGLANYFTIDENNNTYTLPMGEIYGMINAKQDIISDLDDIRNGAAKPNIPMGAIYPLVCSSQYTPYGSQPCDGTEYTKSQFETFWNDYLTDKYYEPSSYLINVDSNNIENGLYNPFNPSGLTRGSYVSIPEPDGVSSLVLKFKIGSDITSEQQIDSFVTIKNGHLYYGTHQLSSVTENSDLYLKYIYMLNTDTTKDYTYKFDTYYSFDDNSYTNTSEASLAYTSGDKILLQSKILVDLVNSYNYTDTQKTYLVKKVALLNTCTYAEYTSDMTTYGQCAKFAVDTVNSKFKTPIFKNKTYIRQALTNDILSNSYNEFLSATGSSDSSVSLRHFVVVANSTINDSQMDWSQWASNLSGKVNTSLNNLSDTGKKVIDGQWVQSVKELSTATAVGTYTIDLADYLPVDDYSYEIYINADAYTESNVARTYISAMNNDMTTSKITLLWGASYARQNTNIARVIADKTRKITIQHEQGKWSGFNLNAIGYRRLGTNS